MDRPWIADHELAPAAAAALIDDQFPDLAPVAVEPLAEGWDNRLFRVNDRWVFRFPRRIIASALIETENRVLPAVAGRLPLPIPVPLHIGRPADGYPWSFSGYAMLPGRPAWIAGLDDRQRAAAAEPLAAFLAELHAVGADAAHAMGAGPDTIGRLDIANRLSWVEERVTVAADLGLIRDPAGIEAVIAGTPTSWRPVPRALAHGDLHAGNILIDDDGTPCGIIDWGDVHVGDPVVDLAIAFPFLPPAARETFFDRYGPVDDSALAVARFRALATTLAVLLWAHDVGEPEIVADARWTLANLAVQ